jgi:hypothetical protein
MDVFIKMIFVIGLIMVEVLVVYFVVSLIGVLFRR